MCGVEFLNYAKFEFLNYAVMNQLFFFSHRFSCGKGLADTALVLLWVSILIYMQDTFINFRFIKNDAFIWNHENPKEGDFIAERAFRKDPLYIFSSNVVSTGGEKKRVYGAR